MPPCTYSTVSDATYINQHSKTHLFKDDSNTCMGMGYVPCDFVWGIFTLPTFRRTDLLCIHTMYIDTTFWYETFQTTTPCYHGYLIIVWPWVFLMHHRKQENMYKSLSWAVLIPRRLSAWCSLNVPLCSLVRSCKLRLLLRYVSIQFAVRH